MTTALATRALKKSIWVFHLNTGACNNCDIEILDCLTPRYDLERFGILLVGSVRHADALLVTGPVTRASARRLERLYEEAPKPCFVVAVGSCACSKGIFKDGYNVVGPVDRYVPVSAYIPGCPPKPEAIILAVARLLESVK